MQLVKVTCEKCGHTWIPMVENPQKCPKCGHYRGTRVYGKDGDKDNEKHAEVR